MILKNLAKAAVLTAVALGSVALAGQAGNTPAHPGTSSQTSPPAPTTPASAPAGPSNSENSTSSSTSPAPAPHITIATEAPAPAPWPLQDRIAWAANLILALIADAGIIFFVFLLRSINRQARYAEAAAQAAAESAQASLHLAQAQERAERPWILVTAEPSVGTPDAFSVIAANRGRGPARIVSLTEGIAFAKDETALPPDPAYKQSESLTPISAMVLLPGESATIKSFRREEVPAVCKNQDQLSRVEYWDERIYLYGKVTYANLQAPDDKQSYDTAWCCWYIHGRQKSGMVMAGKPPYNQHS
jgi:hypothetical protein